MEEKPKPKIYQTTWALIAGFCVVGPFVLPLVWKNPYYPRRTKWIYTVVFTGITLGLVWVSYRGMGILLESYDEAMGGMKELP